MKRILGVQFNNREDAERMFMDEHPDMELGMTGRIIWLIVMIIFYAIAEIPYLVLNMVLTAYSQRTRSLLPYSCSQQIRLY